MKQKPIPKCKGCDSNKAVIKLLSPDGQQYLCLECMEEFK